MTLKRIALMAAICCSVAGGTLAAQEVAGDNISQVSYSDCDCGIADCHCSSESMSDSCGCGESSCDGECESRTGIFANGLANACNLGEPKSLLGDCCGYSAGGWIQLGYHNNNLPLFNSRKNELQLQQGWLYLEKELDTENGFDIGGRVDYLYGTDGPDTQAFGIDNNHWDNQWDNGTDYGHALPQVYGEVGYGDLSVKFGHFYTIIGYEVVAAPDNFFYSHAYTFFNSEPFTHTGALFTYDMCEEIDIFGGYVLGWDSGFEDNGDAVIGGSTVQVTDDISVTSTFVAGRFSDGNANRILDNGAIGGVENGYMQSNVATFQMTDKLDYILQTDYLDTEDATDATVRKTFALNQYLLRQLGDCLAAGVRFEWWNVDAASTGFYGNDVPAFQGDYDIYELTLGLNVRPHANLVFRPEVRFDWVDGNRNELAVAGFDLLENNNKAQTTAAIDAILTF